MGNCHCDRPYGVLPSDASDEDVLRYQREQSRAEVVKQASSVTAEKRGDSELFAKVEGKDGKEHQIPDKAAFVASLLDTFPTVTFRDNSETWVYMDGRYVIGDSWLREWIEARFIDVGETASNQFVREILGAVERQTYGDRREYGTQYAVCLGNGTYDLILHTLQPHNPEDRLLTKLSIEYDPEAKCPRWIQFLDEVIPDEDDRDTLQEFFGYLLDPRNSYQKMLMLIGPKQSGKSTILRVIEGLLGKANVAHQSLHMLASNRFSPARLYGKMVNTFADLPTKVVTDLGVLKSLSGEDSIDAERKGKDFFDLDWGGKAVFSCNALPELKQLDDAFFRRWLCVSIPSSISNDQKDPQLTAKLLEELPGIFNWAVGGYICLGRQHAFTSTDDSGVKRLWLDTANPLRVYVRERIVPEHGALLPTEVAYKDYAEWCEETSREATKLTGFVLSVMAEAKITKARTMYNGSKVTCFQGIRLRKVGDSQVGQTMLECQTGGA